MCKRNPKFLYLDHQKLDGVLSRKKSVQIEGKVWIHFHTNV